MLSLSSQYRIYASPATYCGDNKLFTGPTATVMFSVTTAI